MRRKFLHALFSAMLVMTGAFSYVREFPTQNNPIYRTADSDTQIIAVAQSGQERGTARGIRQRQTVRHLERRPVPRGKRTSRFSLTDVWAAVRGQTMLAVYRVGSLSASGKAVFSAHKFKLIIAFLQSLF